MVLPMTPCWAGLGGDGGAGFELVEHLAGGELAEADAGEEFGLGGEAVFGGDLVVVGLVVLGERHFVLAGFAVEQLLADLDGALALVLVDPVLDLVAGAGRLGEGEPVAAGSVAGLGGDFDDVAVAKLGAEGDDAAVDLGADGGVADFGVDGVGERLDQHGLVVFEVLQRRDDRGVGLPAAGGAAGAAVDDELVGMFGHLRVEVVHQHAHRGFLRPALAAALQAPGGADGRPAGVATWPALSHEPIMAGRK